MARRARTIKTPAYTAYNVTAPPQGDVNALGNWVSNELARVEAAIPRSSVTTVKAAYTALPTDRTILADAAAAAFTVTLPDPARVKFMRATVKRTNAGANQVTIGGTIDGGVNPTLTTQYAAISLVSDGTQWLVDGVATDVLGGIDPAMSPDPQPTAQTDEFTASSLASKWSWVNQGTSTVSFAKGRLVMDAQASGGLGTHANRILVQTAPSGSFTIRARMGNYSTAVNLHAGIIIRRSTNGYFFKVGTGVRTVLATDLFGATSDAYQWTDAATPGTSQFTQATDQRARDFYWQLRYDSVADLIYFDYSPDNMRYINRGSCTASAATVLNGAPDQIGIAANAPVVSPNADVSWDFFRVYGDSNLNR